MQIILLERVEKLGTIGDVVNVKDGYARNFLLPGKKALRANDANRKLFEANRAKIEAQVIPKMGRKAIECNTVFIDGLDVPREDLVGEEGASGLALNGRQFAMEGDL